MPRSSLLLAVVLGMILPSAALAQNAVITGVVRSDAQAPISGALVSIPAVQQTAITNEQGQYRLNIPASQVNGQQVTIAVTSIGFRPAETQITLRPGAFTQNLTLAEQAIQLDEVVVTGAVGRTERRAQSAVVSTIDAARLTQLAPVQSVGNLLQARTPGVVISNRSGTSGTSQTIRIRGISSLTLSNEPLIFVDGIRVSGGDRQVYGVGGQRGSALNDIKIEDIESMEVVKGPAAATLYGSDANAGVINIITKKGRAGSGFTQSFNVEYGETDANFVQPANFGRCTAFAKSRPTTYPACVGVPEGTVLQDRPLERDDAFGNGTYRNMVYSLNGGGQNYGVYFSVGADDDNGTLPSNEYGHISSRANFDFFAHEKLRMEFGWGITRTTTRLPNNDNNIYGYLGGGMLGDPRTIGSAKDGWYAPNRQSLAISSIENSDKTMRLQPRAAAHYSPFDWFTNRFTVGADLARTSATSFWAKNDEGWWDNAPRNTGQIGEARRSEDRYTMEYLGNVTQTLTSDLRADFSFGAQALARQYDITNATGQGLVTNDVRSVNAAAQLTGGGQSSSQNRDIGVFGQTQFSWLERVYVQLGLRRDQSSSFGAESKPFYSPKVGVSYVISDEPFFRNLIDGLGDNAITTLRLRGAYGVTGRQPSSGARSTYSPATNQISPTQVAIGVRPNDTGNPELRAEKGQELELGFEAGLINDRLGLELTYYNKKMTDQILELPVPGSLGAEGPRVNVGSLLNEGFEISSNARLITRDNFAWEVRTAFNTLRNEVLDLGDVPESATRKVGFPLFGAWDYTIREVDLANNRVIVSDTLEFIGNGFNYPGWDGSLTNTVTLFQNITIYAQMDGRGDRMVYNSNDQFRDRSFGISELGVLGAAAFGTDANGNPTDEARIKYMRKFGPFVTEQYTDEDGNPAGGRNLNRRTVAGDYYEDGTFVRLREASVSYRLPNTLVQQYMRARSASFGITMRNLRTWTDYSGLDPETGQFLSVPSDRRWTARFNFTF